MIAGPGLRWALTALFAVIALHGLFSVLRPAGGRTARPVRPVTDTVGGLLHTVMAVAMAVMVWPAGMEVPVTPQVLLFAAAALWFLALAVLPHPGDAMSGAGPAQARLPDVQHAVMAGAMAWMVDAMAGSMTESTRQSSAGHEGHHMAGGSMMKTTLSDGTSRSLATALALGFALAAWWWLARAFDTARATDRVSAGAPAAVTSYGRHDAFHFACHGGMGAGMAVMLLAMA